MSLIKTSMLNALAVITRLGTALFLNKVLAVYVGPAGYAVIGQFQNVLTMITTLASGAVNTGVTKYTAEYYDDQERQKAVWRTAGKISVVGVLIASLFLIIFHEQLAISALKQKDFGGVFIWLAAALLLYVFNGLLLAILNGKKEVTLYVTANISGSLIGAVSATILASQFGLYGALVALAINQSLTFFVTFSLCRRTVWFELRNLFGRIDPDIAKKLFGFTIMTATMTIASPTSQLFVRNHLTSSFGMQAAGYWQAVWKISDIYLMLVTTTLSLYYLPRLSEIRESSELKREIWQGYRIILPAAALGATIIYLLRNQIIIILFTPQFTPMSDLFIWQLVGDVVKIASWLLGYVLIGRAMISIVVITEFFFAASFIGLTIIFTRYLGISGVTVAYLCNYILHWCTMIFIVNRYIVLFRSPENV